MLLKNHLSLRLIIGGFLLIVFLISYWQWLSYQNFLTSPINVPTSDRIITIKPGDSINRLAQQWQQQNIISNSLFLKLFCALNPQYKNIKVGEYQLDKIETPKSLMIKLAQGSVIQYPFTIIEGMSSFQVIQILKNTPTIIDDLATEPQMLIDALGIQIDHLEGWLFPDTYYYTRNETSTRLLKRAVKVMQQVLAEEWDNRAADLPYQSAYEALIMASIIEKETGIASEREQIAGVFVRRLQKRMRLQTDPTVIYGVGADYDGDITYKHLRTKTPYNTYMINGLPPTPIAMPSRKAIYAALHPADGDTLYFVADGTGGHYFSVTLAEHKRATRRLLKKQKQKQN